MLKFSERTALIFVLLPLFCRLASWIKDLKQLARALLLVIPKMFAISFLLMILFFVFAILLVDLFKYSYDKGETSADYFGSLESALFTLFQIMTLDGWSAICKDLTSTYSWAWIPVVAFVIISSFFFLNLVIAVVCEAVTSVHRDTVVKYIQEDISAATSAREALKVDDRLDEVSGSIQLLMQTQITLLEALQEKVATVQHHNSTISYIPGQIQQQTAALQQELSDSLFGSVIPSKAIKIKPPGILRDKLSSDVTVAVQQVNHVPTYSVQTLQEDFEKKEYWAKQGMTELQVEKVLGAIAAIKR
jgi:hypothetical protein